MPPKMAMPPVISGPMTLSIAPVLPVTLTVWPVMAMPFWPPALIVPELLTVAVVAEIAWRLAPITSIKPVLAVTLTVSATMANLSAVMMPVLMPSPILLTVAVLLAWMAIPPATTAEIVPELLTVAVWRALMALAFPPPPVASIVPALAVIVAFTAEMPPFPPDILPLLLATVALVTTMAMLPAAVVSIVPLLLVILMLSPWMAMPFAPVSRMGPLLLVTVTVPPPVGEDADAVPVRPFDCAVVTDDVDVGSIDALTGARNSAGRGIGDRQRGRVTDADRTTRYGHRIHAGLIGSRRRAWGKACAEASETGQDKVSAAATRHSKKFGFALIIPNSRVSL